MTLLYKKQENENIEDEEIIEGKTVERYQNLEDITYDCMII